MSRRREKVNVGIVGAGAGAGSLLDILADYPEVKIVGLAYRNPDRPAVEKAKKMGVALFKDYRKHAESPDVNLIIDASGSEEVEAYLEKNKKSSAEVLSGYSAWFLWKLVEEHISRKEEMARNLAEQEVLYSAGVMVASAANTQQALDLIMESALSLTGMSAGTLALYSEERGTMQIKVTMGFEGVTSSMNYEWEVRAGGLTGFILSNSKPTVIENLLEEKTFDAASLVGIGIRSLIAVPLKVEGKIVGILYVDDFKPRYFTEREVNTLNLLGAQAAAALDKALLLEQAEHMAVTDELTKLYNHRYFMRTFEQELRRSDRYDYPLSVCMIDVDHFKHFNDTHGHLQGNVVLSSVAKILSAAARDTDVVARYGGEEFAVILVQADEEQARFVANRFRSEVEAYIFPGEEKQPGGLLTVSIGVATFPDDASDTLELVEKADMALYHSKASGRNRVTQYSEVKHISENFPKSEKHRRN